MRAKIADRPDILNRRRAVSRAEIQSLQKQVNLAGEVEGQKLLAEINQGGFTLGKHQTRFAANWLKNKIWKKNGEIRATSTAKVFGFREKAVIEGMEKITFEGFRHRYDQEKGRFRMMPIYRCHAADASFDYAVDFWGRPEIVA